MTTMTRRLPLVSTILVCVLGLAGATIKLVGQAAPPNREWRTYGADLANTGAWNADCAISSISGVSRIQWSSATITSACEGSPASGSNHSSVAKSGR